jgi:hypothetical protein
MQNCSVAVPFQHVLRYTIDFYARPTLHHRFLCICSAPGVKTFNPLGELRFKRMPSGLLEVWRHLGLFLASLSLKNKLTRLAYIQSYIHSYIHKYIRIGYYKCKYIHMYVHAQLASTNLEWNKWDGTAHRIVLMTFFWTWVRPQGWTWTPRAELGVWM